MCQSYSGVAILKVSKLEKKMVSFGLRCDVFSYRWEEFRNANVTTLNNPTGCLANWMKLGLEDFDQTFLSEPGMAFSGAFIKASFAGLIRPYLFLCLCFL